MKSKQTGTTPSEEYLAKLGKRAFLSAWMHMNPYTDEGPQGRELCDMLVVFGENVLIFSVKESAFNHQHDSKIAWQRWYKKAISRSVTQIFGAEKMILQHPERIFLDKERKNKFPFPSNVGSIKIHRICIALGIGNACAKLYGEKENTSSLRLNFGLKDVQQHIQPLVIGHPCLESGFVHIFDDFALDTVFQEVDTIIDFVDYLDKREKFLTQKNFTIMAAGEEELLAIYLANINERGEHNFAIPLNSEQLGRWIIIDQGHWKDLVTQEQYIVKKEADKISYKWDALIEKFIEYGEALVLEGDHFIKSSVQSSVRDAQIKYMAEESRIERRMLMQLLESIMKSVPQQPKVECLHQTARIVGRYSPSYFGNKAYVFLIVPTIVNVPYGEYRAARLHALLHYCLAAKLKLPDMNYIVGIAREPFSCKSLSEDFFVLDGNNWAPEMKKIAQEMPRVKAILEDTTFRVTYVNTKEYPEY